MIFITATHTAINEVCESTQSWWETGNDRCKIFVFVRRPSCAWFGVVRTTIKERQWEVKEMQWKVKERQWEIEVRQWMVKERQWESEVRQWMVEERQ